MKKNIQINIFGTIYAIDEDAYQLLNNYLEGMKQYFCRQEGGDEIADDIEHRVAELLWQYKEQGTAAYQCAEEQCGMFSERRQELGDTVQQRILWHIPGLARLWQ